MSARVCYIEREDRGAVLRRLRVVGARADEAWEAPAGPVDGEAVRRAAALGAAWAAERITGRLGSRVLDRLCLDVDGAVCTWVTANTAEPRLLRAVIEQEATPDADDPFAEAGHSSAGRFPDLPGEVGYQALDPRRGKGERGRVPVFAVPEVAARALIDALDTAGVQVGACMTLWQAMLRAWGAGPRASSDRVVADSERVVAIAICQPGERVVWAWGRGDAVVAAGAFRTRAGRHANAPAGLVLPDGSEGGYETPPPAAPVDFGGRLATDWLAWSAQIGVVPSRVVWVGPVEGQAGTGLSGGEIASSLRRAAPGATIDVIDEPDPIGLTLRRLAEYLDDAADPRPTPTDHLALLTNRPGRIHRAMYRWLAVVFIAASVAMGALAWSFWQRREESIEQLAQIRANQRELLEKAAPDLVDDRMALLNLRGRVDQARARRLDTGAIPPPKPVLRELETLAFVLGNPDYELVEIDIGPLSVSFRVRVQDTLAFEGLQSSLFGIAGSSVAWTPLNPRQVNNKIEVSATGTWMREDRAGGGDS